MVSSSNAALIATCSNSFSYKHESTGLPKKVRHVSASFSCQLLAQNVYEKQALSIINQTVLLLSNKKLVGEILKLTVLCYLIEVE